MTFRIPRRAAAAAAMTAAAALTLSGCGSADPSAGADDGLTVVASTNVWGSVVEAVAGDAAEITTIIDDPSADPHSYESTPRDAADVAGADLVVFNGGGYDEFVEQILNSSAEDVPTVQAFALHGGEGEAGEGHEGDAHEGGEHEGSEHEGGEHAHGGVNEHVWYDLATVEAVADQVAERLGTVAPGQAATFTRNAEAFHRQIDTIAQQVATLQERNQGGQVALTEPVAVHLVQAAGLTDATPPAFAQAVEEETDPPAGAVAEIQQLVTGGSLAALVYNPQAETPVTEQVRSRAEAAGLPVVEMTETLPQGVGYVEWMTGQVDALSAAVQE